MIMLPVCIPFDNGAVLIGLFLILFIVIMAAAAPNNLVITLTEHVLELTPQQRAAITQNGWVRLGDFRDFGYQQIKDWTDTMEKRTLARGGVNFGSVAFKKLQALAYWCNQQLLRGKVLDCGDFDADALQQSMEDFQIDYKESKRESDAQMPPSFTYDKWVDWHQAVITYLKSKKGVRNIPLYYVIRKEPCPIGIHEMQPIDEIIYNAPHQGRAFDIDNKEVHRIIDELTNGTDAADWIKSHKRSRNGKGSWDALCQHYDGPAEGDKRITIARSNIQHAFYKNEQIFSFEKYSTKLKRAFDTLRQYNQPKSHKEEVEILLNNINTNNMQLVSCIQICRNSHGDNFQDAQIYLSTQIAQIFPQTQPGSSTRGKHKIPKRNVSKITRTKGGKVMCNGVDITDTTRYFSPKEWNKLTDEAKQKLRDDPKRKAKKESLQSKKRAKISATGTTTADSSEDNVRSIAAAVINGVMHASRAANDNDSIHGNSTNSSRVSMPQHGTHATRQAASSSRRRTYDHLGNIIDE